MSGPFMPLLFSLEASLRHCQHGARVRTVLLLVCDVHHTEEHPPAGDELSVLRRRFGLEVRACSLPAPLLSLALPVDAVALVRRLVAKSSSSAPM